MYAKFVWIVYLTRNWNWANSNFKIQFWRNREVYFAVILTLFHCAPLRGTVKQMQPIFRFITLGTGNLSWKFHEKCLFSLSVFRNFIFLCYIQDYNEKNIFRFIVPHPRILIRMKNIFNVHFLHKYVSFKIMIRSSKVNFMTIHKQNGSMYDILCALPTMFNYSCNYHLFVDFTTGNNSGCTQVETIKETKVS
jgi:hypothetical protein